MKNKEKPVILSGKSAATRFALLAVCCVKFSPPARRPRFGNIEQTPKLIFGQSCMEFESDKSGCLVCCLPFTSLRNRIRCCQYPQNITEDTMKADDQPLNDFLGASKKIFSIPVYQRNYEWTEKQCRKLWDDIIAVAESTAEEPTHFIGSIVYDIQPVKETGYEEYSIIDGQQRITTLTLLYAVLYQKAKEQSGNTAEDIYNSYLQNPYAQFDENKLKLKPTDNNKEALNFVFGKDNKTPSDKVKETNLYRNYQFFFGKVNQENWQTVYTGLARLILVYMKIQKGDNAQRIFESLNATGVDLSKGDLIRNYVLTGLERQEQETVFQNYWIHIEKNTVDEGERKQASKKKTNTWNKISMFFLRFLQYKNQTKDVKEDEVFEKFKDYLNGKNLTDVLKELKLYSEGFYLFLNPQKVTDPEMRQHLIYLKQLKSSVIHPFLLPVYADLRNEVIDEKMFVAVLELLQSYHWRRMIANGEVGIFTSNYLLNVMPMLYDTAKPADNSVKYVEAIEKVLLRRKFPDDKQIMEALHTKNIYALDNSWQRYLFERLGRYIDDEGNVDYSSVTTEHVFPENPETNWNDGSHILSEDELQKMADIHHRLGNLTPLIHRKNSGLGNKSFLEKRDHSEYGYQNSAYPQTRQLGNIAVWNAAAIEKRTEDLTKLFLQVWKRPDSALLTDERHELVDIFSVEKIRKNEEFVPTYAQWNGQTLEFDNFTDLLMQIVKENYKQYPDVVSGVGHSSIKIVADSISIPQHAKKSGGYRRLNDMNYLIVHSSSNDKIVYLKKLLAALTTKGISAALRLSYSVGQRDNK